MVVWTESAKADLRAIHDLIAHDSCYYARKVTQDIREKMDALGEFQKMGRIVPEINDDLVREVSLYSYRIIYEIKNQTIFVLVVVHQRRNMRDDDVPREVS